MKNIEKVLKAMANRRRLAIILHLRKAREAMVGDIADKINLSFKATSKHLGILKAVDIVEYEQRGLEYYYRLVTPMPPVAQSILSLL